MKKLIAPCLLLVLAPMQVFSADQDLLDGCRFVVNEFEGNHSPNDASAYNHSH